MFQSSVALQQGFGVVGEIFLAGPTRAQSGIIDSDGVTNPNRVGRVFTQVAAADGHCTIGGSGKFYGILSNPKVYPSYGAASGTLAPTLDLPQYAQGEFVQESTGLIVALDAAANIGDEVDWDTTTGALTARPSQISVTATLILSQAVGPPVVNTNTLNVSAVGTGSGKIYPGAVLTGPTGPVTVTAQNSGTTGGIGIYAVTTDAAAVGSGSTFTGKTVPYTGKAHVPGGSVTRYSTSGAGNAVITVGSVNS